MELNHTDGLSSTWERLAPLLDEAMRQLNRAEQDAVILRYFEGKSGIEAAATLGISEDAAQKRTSRAIEKLREHFAREGLSVASIVLISAICAQRTNAAPAPLAARVVNASLAPAVSGGIVHFFSRLFLMNTPSKIASIVILTVVAVLLMRFALRAPRGSIASTNQASAGTAELGQQPSSEMKSAPSISNVVAPIAPPVPKQMQAPATGSGEPTKADPQAVLDDVINDIAKRLQALDSVGLFEKYESPKDMAKYTPEQKANLEEIMRQQLANPDNEGQVQKYLQDLAPLFNSLVGQTPEMNTAGDEATYYLPRPASMAVGPDAPATIPMVFEKVDGKWYIKTGPIRAIAPGDFPIH